MQLKNSNSDVLISLKVFTTALQLEPVFIGYCALSGG